MKDAYIDEMELSVLKSIKNDICEKNKAKLVEKEDDAEDCFAKSIAHDLRGLGQREKCMAKNEIRNIIFKYQMSTFDGGQRSNFGGFNRN